MQRFFAEPVVRLFLRALLVAGVAFSSKFFLIDPTGQHITYQTAALGAAAISAALAFAETFTPLNGLVGLFKQLDSAAIAAPAAPIEPPGDTTEAAAA
jgi:hypothetical protein